MTEGVVGAGDLRRGVAEQVLLHVEIHEAGRDVDSDQTGMTGFAFRQCGKVGTVAGDGCVAVFHGAADQRPALPGSQANASNPDSLAPLPPGSG